MKELRILDLGQCEYHKAWEIQQKTHQQVVSKLGSDVLILVEHSPVLTLGKHATEDNLKVSIQSLAEKNISVVRIDRGGEVTAHMPGQLVAYPIINLARKSLGVRDYVCKLESTVIETLGQYGIQSHRHPQHPGVWVGDQKVAAVGVRVKQRATLHGASINVNNSFELFDRIIPCGIRDLGVTSMRELGCGVSLDNVKKGFIESFQKLMAYEGAAQTSLSGVLHE